VAPPRRILPRVDQPCSLAKAGSLRPSWQLYVAGLRFCSAPLLPPLAACLDAVPTLIATAYRTIRLTSDPYACRAVHILTGGAPPPRTSCFSRSRVCALVGVPTQSSSSSSSIRQCILPPRTTDALQKEPLGPGAVRLHHPRSPARCCSHRTDLPKPRVSFAPGESGPREVEDADSFSPTGTTGRHTWRRETALRSGIAYLRAAPASVVVGDYAVAGRYLRLPVFRTATNQP